MRILQIVTAWLILIVIPHCGIHAFGYSKRDQHLWPKKCKSCAGKRQSPVAICTSKAIVKPFPALELIGYHDFLPMPQLLKNNEKTVILSIDKNATQVYRTLPYIFGGMLQNQTFEMEEVHFHWGLKNNRGAEHVLNGIRYSMETHIIHYNMAYGNFLNALQHEDGIAVIASFFQLQDEDNERLQPFITSLIPSNTDVFYTYKGSLTTPPCSEVVTWNIFANPIPISFRQINMFRRLSNGEGILGDNFRLLQDIGQRKIYTRRLDSTVSTKDIKHGFTNLSWFWV
ncbi:carbonic anhydrase 2 isoform X2 [Mycetomoellerius zeteki]|uniref:carbonic anhydrase 2 isoform X2 n=1 Tax=Mycetomoellerius zeteki TaxID=64791 RepID=UPI00084EA06F|nr:PREDICTED: carbonic anhydrase 2-like isoform X2 [Trachymyrmex zeteki]